MDITDYLIYGTLGTICCFLLLVLGGIGAIAAAYAGKKYIILVGIITAIVPAFLGAMVGDMAVRFEGNLGIVIGAAVGFIITMVMPLYACTQGEYFRQLVREAPGVAHIGRRIFARLTSGEEIKSEDLDKALTQDSWTAEERAAIEHMKHEIEEVGHVSGSKTNSSITIMPVGGSNLILPSSSTTKIYAISRADLDSYAERRATKWKVWLK